MSSSSAPTYTINITPLIDVLLVLLVIFLVMIPTMIKVEPVLLPPDEEGDVPLRPPVEIKLHADATATIDQGSPIMATDLWSQLRPKVGVGSTVFVDFEDGVPWSDVVGTVDGVRGLVPDNIQVAVRIRLE